MSLVRFDPFTSIRDLDRWFEMPSRWVDAPALRTEGTWTPRVDVFDEDGALVVRAEVPGVDVEDIEVTVEGGTLTISGSRRFEKDTEEKGFHRKEIFEGSFSRKIMLPEGTDPEAVKATSKDGILEVSVPHKPEVLPHRIAVAIEK